MATQIEALQERLDAVVASRGADAPYAKALRQQLDGYRSMAANREENFLVATMPKQPAPSSAKLPPEPKREDFKNQAAFEEARGYWRSHVGRIRGFAARAAMAKPQEELPPSQMPE